MDNVDYSDEVCPVIYLEVPKEKVVLFQAHFELYEGLGIVRTLDMRKNLLCVITTTGQLPDCLCALEELKELIEWKPAPVPLENDREKYLGYFRNAESNT